MTWGTQRVRVHPASIDPEEEGRRASPWRAPARVAGEDRAWGKMNEFEKEITCHVLLSVRV